MTLGTGTAPLLRFMLSWVSILSLPFRFTSGSDFTHKHAAISSMKSRGLAVLFWMFPCHLNVHFFIWGGFLIRRSSAIRRFIAGFLKCDSRTIMKSFLEKIAHKLTGNLHKNPPKFPENSRAIFLRNDFLIVRLSHLRNTAKNLRIAELRLMRNPPQIFVRYSAMSYYAMSYYTILIERIIHK